MPHRVSDKINSWKKKTNIPTTLLTLVNQIELLLTKNYNSALNDSVIKILDDIETAYRKQQKIDNNPIIHLIILTNSVSDKKVTNALNYVKKFNDEIAEIEARIKDDIAALKLKKDTILKQSDPSNNFKYTLSQSKGVRIDKYIGNTTFVVIPEQIENLPVTGIGYRAFDNPDLKKVVIPESVNTIVYCAFVSQQPLHILFKGYKIQITAQSFLAPQVTFYYTNNAVAKILYGIADNNSKCSVNYNASDF